MSILNKFKSIEINIIDMLSDEDKKFLDDMQNTYNEVWNDLSNITYHAKEIDTFKNSCNIKRKYSKNYESLFENINRLIDINRILNETILSLNSSFNFEIITYFERTYNINLEELRIDKPDNFKTDKLNYNEIIERMFTLGMNGKNFEEIRISQIKQNMEKIIRYCNTSCKKNKLIIDGFIWFRSPSYSWETDHVSQVYRRMKPLALCLKEFCGCPIELIYKSEYDRYETNFNDVGGLTEVNYNVINSFKLFKNGKLEINFTNHDSAVNFAKEWLNRNV